MNMTSSQALWSRLTTAGLTSGDMPEPDEQHAPWYVRVMLGIAGIIAAAFLLGFVGVGLAAAFKTASASIVFGLFAIFIAWGMFNSGRGDFATMFALSVSFSGQAMLIFGVFRLFGSNALHGMPFATAALIQVALAVIIPNFIHRVACGYGAALAFSYACAALGLPFITTGLLAAAIAALWLNEARLADRHALVAPVGYGLTLAFIQIEGQTLVGFSSFGWFGSRITVPGYAWLGEALIIAALAATAIMLLKRSGADLRAPKTLLAILMTLLIGATSLKAPGIAGGLMIALLGFSNGNRVLTGLGITALLVYLCSYYYLLDATLLVKSAVLLTTGIVLLATRWLVMNIIMPDGDARA